MPVTNIKIDRRLNNVKVESADGDNINITAKYVLDISNSGLFRVPQSVLKINNISLGEHSILKEKEKNIDPIERGGNTRISIQVDSTINSTEEIKSSIESICNNNPVNLKVNEQVIGIIFVISYNDIFKVEVGSASCNIQSEDDTGNDSRNQNSTNNGSSDQTGDITLDGPTVVKQGEENTWSATATNIDPGNQNQSNAQFFINRVISRGDENPEAYVPFSFQPPYTASTTYTFDQLLIHKDSSQRDKTARVEVGADRFGTVGGDIYDTQPLYVLPEATQGNISGDENIIDIDGPDVVDVNSSETYSINSEDQNLENVNLSLSDPDLVNNDPSVDNGTFELDFSDSVGDFVVTVTANGAIGAIQIFVKDFEITGPDRVAVNTESIYQVEDVPQHKSTTFVSSGVTVVDSRGLRGTVQGGSSETEVDTGDWPQFQAGEDPEPTYTAEELFEALETGTATMTVSIGAAEVTKEIEVYDPENESNENTSSLPSMSDIGSGM